MLESGEEPELRACQNHRAEGRDLRCSGRAHRRELTKQALHPRHERPPSCKCRKRLATRGCESHSELG